MQLVVYPSFGTDCQSHIQWSSGRRRISGSRCVRNVCKQPIYAA